MVDDALIWVEGEAFEDTIDGYFPLQVSLAQMLDRNEFSVAVVTLSLAPIMHIPGLPPSDPVPLNIRSGYAGLIDDLSLCVTKETMSGFGTWRWLTPGLDRGSCFDPSTRLAEPAYLSGIGFREGSLDTTHLGPLRPSERKVTAVKFGDPPERNSGVFWGPFALTSGVVLRPLGWVAHGECSLSEKSQQGLFILRRNDGTARA